MQRRAIALIFQIARDNRSLWDRFFLSDLSRKSLARKARHITLNMKNVELQISVSMQAGWQIIRIVFRHFSFENVRVVR